MYDVMTAIVYENGEDTNGRFNIPYKRYEAGEVIDFFTHKFRVVNSNSVIAIVEEVVE